MNSSTCTHNCGSNKHTNRNISKRCTTTKSVSICFSYTLPPTYPLPVMVAKPRRSSKFTKLISIISWSPGVTGLFQRTPFTPVKKNSRPPPSSLIGGDRQIIPPVLQDMVYFRTAVKSISHDKSLTKLCHCLDHEHAGHNRAIRKVSSELRLIGSDTFDAHCPLASLKLNHPVYQ